MDAEALDVWRQSLQSLRLDDIRAGLGRVLEWSKQSGNGWPPNLPEFLALCEGTPQAALYRRLELEQQEHQKRLPAPEKITSAGGARAHLQGIRAMLKPKAPGGGDKTAEIPNAKGGRRR